MYNIKPNANQLKNLGGKFLEGQNNLGFWKTNTKNFAKMYENNPQNVCLEVMSQKGKMNHECPKLLNKMEKKVNTSYQQICFNILDMF